MRNTLPSSIYPASDRTAWIIEHRPARAAVHPWLPNGFFLEQERAASGAVVDSAGILLTNKECPWHCLMCDLWKHTLDRTVPAGAISAQIEYALQQLKSRPNQLKLYNSGSFFDPAAIPVADYPGVAETVAFASHVIVESHPRLVGSRALKFRDLLKGSLEVAMGLETVHPQVLPKLNKRFTLDHFTAAADLLKREGIAMRAFVLVKPPFLSEEEAVLWAVRSVEFAFECGAGAVSLIPTRLGNGALEALATAGEFAPPRIDTLEIALAQCLALNKGRVFADTWDLEKFSTCSSCFPSRKVRLETMNLSQSESPQVQCDCCGLSLKPMLSMQRSREDLKVNKAKLGRE
jgi:archaeosine synthase beta-subunit